MNILHWVIRRAVWGCRILCGIALFVALVIYGLLFAAQPWHDLTLGRMEYSLASVTHPQMSSIVENKIVFGSEYTDSWNCNYFVGQLRKTTLSPSDVTRAYQNEAVSLFAFELNMRVQVEFVDGKTSFPLGHPADTWEFDALNRISIKDRMREKTYYIVFLFEESRLGLGDARCYETGLGFPEF